MEDDLEIGCGVSLVVSECTKACTTDEGRNNANGMLGCAIPAAVMTLLMEKMFESILKRLRILWTGGTTFQTRPGPFRYG